MIQGETYHTKLLLMIFQIPVNHKGNLEREKLHYLLKKKLRYNSELITLAIHVTILTYLILTSPYILTHVLQVEASLMVYHIQGILE